MSPSPPDWLLPSLHYTFPTAVFVYFSIATSVAVCTLQTSSAAPKVKHSRPKVIVYLLLLFMLLYLGQLILKIIQTFLGSTWPEQDTVVGLLSCILVFGIEQSALGDGIDVVWHPYIGSWVIAAVLEPVIAVLSIIDQHRQSQISGHALPHVALSFEMIIVSIRYITLLAVIFVYFIGRQKPRQDKKDEETSPLLPKPGQGNGSSDAVDSGYGTSDNSDNSENDTDATNSPTDPESPWERRQREAKDQMEKRLQSEGSWIAYAKGFLIFFPYIWPVHSRRLQVYAGLVGVCLIAGNALNLLIPRQMGIILDALNGTSDRNPWIEVVVFAALRLAASEAGINLIRSMLWLPVEYYGEEAIQVAAYSHVMNLSADFHDSKSSSDLIVAISHGTSISRMLESICFEAIPMLIDLVVAFIYLSIKFGPYEGFITVMTGVAFIQAAAHLIARFKEKRRKMVKTFFEEHYIKQAGIQGWHTVSAFNQIPYEEDRYKKAISSEMSAMKGLYAGYLIGHAFQYLILLCGLIAGAFLAVYQVTHGQSSAGDFVMLLTYWGQLTAPLRFFSNLGRSISQDLVYAERLLGVMLEKPTIVDKPDATPLKLNGARVEFRNVGFSYDKKKDILKGVNLTVPPGKTAAFVGATGAGKSTILRLLDRFYEVSEGAILIDGQDIRNVQLASLRESIGIVPQAPILFDDTIMNNIRYARLTASDDEIFEACKAAAIHDHLMSFSEGYQTRVGERGVKISGGELQRIAIARAILKKPDLVLLDEATSSVDTETEQKIQDGLKALCEARTTFIVAHRLSTVMNADIIFVVSGGEIVEQGTHEELLEKRGKYSELWSKQIFVKPKESQDLKDASDADASATERDEESSDDLLTKKSSSQSKASTSENTAKKAAVSASPAGTSNPSKERKEAIQNTKLVTTPAKTPNGHKKEGSRLNPGAPEFTPRSTVDDRNGVTDDTDELGTPTNASKKNVDPERSDWADDVEIQVLSTDIAPDRESITRNENKKPGNSSPIASIVVTAYRHFEPLSSSRSASDPVPSSAPPGKTCPPVSKTSSNEVTNSISNNVLQNKANDADRPPQRGRGRGGRYRGSRNHGISKRHNTNRNTSNPSKTDK